MFIRGFKTWCEEFSLQVRHGLDLQAHAPLNPLALANSLGITVWRPDNVPDLAAHTARRLSTKHAECWSAITVSRNRRHIIVYNPSHSQARQRSDITHEIAHILLDHKPTQVFFSPLKGYALRTHDKDQEGEASWLAGSLLLPRAALVHIRRRQIEDREACRLYGVSQDLLRFRLNATGVNIQFARTGRSERNAAS